MSCVISQLPLNIQLRDDATFASFFIGNNAQIIKAIQTFAHGKGEPFLFLWGSQSAGKSHLLQAVCHEASLLNISAVYLPLKEWQSLSPRLLEDVESRALVCLDDIQAIATQKEWEEALFHAFNRIRASQTRLLISADRAPSLLPLNLPDLKSRLSWGVTYHLQSLNDEQKLQALMLRAKARGLTLNKQAGQFLLTRSSRDMNQLFSVLDRLDHASLAEQRRLTIPFLKKILGTPTVN